MKSYTSHKKNYRQHTLQAIWAFGLIEKWSCIWMPIAIGNGKYENMA
ncbi:hypothetical protein [Flavobacterium agrisoli]|uniref:Uncharacterized protein n=1 Tax=Flavobacterium agrisoli TaxID=2793066 RepID=A0A934UIV7_9FLAO|nr:hypothetical protein [Flavobacterium agrisoli]MBK0369316.1 hypothetical protein [Flavobacterium agrisoli]